MQLSLELEQRLGSSSLVLWAVQLHAASQQLVLALARARSLGRWRALRLSHSLRVVVTRQVDVAHLPVALKLCTHILRPASAVILLSCSASSFPTLLPRHHLTSRGRLRISSETRFGGSLLLRDMAAAGGVRSKQQGSCGCSNGPAVGWDAVLAVAAVLGRAGGGGGGAVWRDDGRHARSKNCPCRRCWPSTQLHASGHA